MKLNGKCPNRNESGIDRTMEIAQLVVSPAILLGAFIFFWKESKAGRVELETRLVQRMDRMEDRLEARIVALEDKMDKRFVALEDKMDTRVGRLEGVLITRQKAS